MNKIIKILTGVIAGVLLACYIGGGVFFRTHFYPDTSVDGIEIGRAEPDEAMEKLRAELIRGEITVSLLGKNYTVPCSDVLEITDEDRLNKLLSVRNYYEWPVEAFRTHVISTEKTIQCDAEKLKADMEKSGIFSVSATPADAVLSSFETGKGYRIIPDRNGCNVNEADTLEYVRAKINEGNRKIDLTDRCTVKAKITADNADLNRECADLNRIIAHNIVMSYQGEAVALNGDTLNQWITKDENGVPSLDRNKVVEYSDGMQNMFADRFAALQKRTGFKYYVDAEQLSAILTEQLESAENATASEAVEIPVLEASPDFDPDLGMSYIDVNLGAQTVTVYENAKVIMQTACVTGLPTAERRTHEGVFHIYYKQRNRTLRGEHHEYASFVNYWMPFDKGRGLHDATWRGKFGGDIYKYAGSHGCVNLPKDFAEELYGKVYVGETVYVH